MKNNYAFTWFDSNENRNFRHQVSNREEAATFMRSLKEAREEAREVSSFCIFVYGTTRFCPEKSVGYFYYYNGSEWMISKL